MTFDFANVVGLDGSALMVIAYAYSNVAKAIDFKIFNLLNLVGALLLLYSLTVHFNIAAMALEVIWAIVALLGLFQAFRRSAK